MRVRLPRDFPDMPSTHHTDAGSPPATMSKERLTAFTDGVIAIILTIMVLELKVPAGSDWAALQALVPVLLSYVLSFVYVAIYWNNHHHMLHTAHHVNGSVLWTNLNLLFWLSLVPLATAWMDEHHHEAIPVALYGVVLLMSGLAYTLLQRSIVCLDRGEGVLARAVGKDLKGKASLVLYALAIGLAFVQPRISLAIYIAVALMWVVPDRRIERVLGR